MSNERPVAGGRYHDLLTDWWAKLQSPITYPGSVLQSAIILSGRDTGLEPANFRVTEKCKENCQRLKHATRGLGVSPSPHAFQEKINWLTEKENLVLLVDPYSMTQSADLDEGQMDMEQLSVLLERCWGKRRCVIGVWYSTIRTMGEIQDARLTQMKDCAEANASIARSFAYGIYDMVWIGIRDGRDVVDAIPKPTLWKQSWLANIVKEQSLSLIHI